MEVDLLVLVGEIEDAFTAEDLLHNDRKAVHVALLSDRVRHCRRVVVAATTVSAHAIRRLKLGRFPHLLFNLRKRDLRLSNTVDRSVVVEVFVTLVVVLFGEAWRAVEHGQSKIGDIEREAAVDHTIGARQVAVILDFAVLDEDHALDDIMNEMMLERRLQFDLLVLQQVLFINCILLIYILYYY